MSDFTKQEEISETSDSNVLFSSVELDLGVDFFPTGDEGTLVISGSGFGEGGFGEGPYGGSISYSYSSQTTVWRNIDTP